jgi:transcriptional regulator with XRE-family HTH domain
MARQRPVLIRSGDAILKARMALDLSQADVANEVTKYLQRTYPEQPPETLEVNAPQLARWERDEVEVPIRYVVALSAVLHIPVHMLLGQPDPRRLTKEQGTLLALWDEIQNPRIKQMTMDLVRAEVAADRRLRSEMGSSEP